MLIIYRNVQAYGLGGYLHKQNRQVLIFFKLTVHTGACCHCQIIDTTVDTRAHIIIICYLIRLANILFNEISSKRKLIEDASDQWFENYNDRNESLKAFGLR